jgi:hypothetical protein
LEIIPGVEINTIHKSSDGASQDVHILGYFIDRSDAKLRALLQRQRDARLEHARKCVEAIAATSVPITLETAQKHAGRGAIGKMHLARAIIEAGGAKDASEAYDKYLVRGSEFFIDRNGATPEEAIEAITGSGGIASIAHPGKEAQMFDLILRLKQAGLGAVEAYHRVHCADRTKQYVRFAQRNDLLVTGGSDCHGPFEQYAATVGTIRVPLSVVENLRSRAKQTAPL